jgi:hypothetical protein
MHLTGLEGQASTSVQSGVSCCYIYRLAIPIAVVALELHDRLLYKVVVLVAVQENVLRNPVQRTSVKRRGGGGAPPPPPTSTLHSRRID